MFWFLIGFAVILGFFLVLVYCIPLMQPSNNEPSVNKENKTDVSLSIHPPPLIPPQYIFPLQRRSTRLRIGFHQPHLTERGTSVALYDYADFNETLLKNQSYIFYQINHPITHALMEEACKKRFGDRCIAYESFDQLDDLLQEHNISACYFIKHGGEVNQVSHVMPSLIHCIFQSHHPHGTVYAAISEEVACGRCPVVPHMIALSPASQEDGVEFRKLHNIPLDALVLGRHGGIETFNIQWVQEEVKDVVQKDPNVWFVFVNTEQFYLHPHIVHLPVMVDTNQKACFIAGCDAMIHARTHGETFGLAIGEFSVANKPILTTRGAANFHLKILGAKAMVLEQVGDVLKHIKTLQQWKRDGLLTNAEQMDFNCYKDYTPAKVMQIFQNVFLEPLLLPKLKVAVVLSGQPRFISDENNPCIAAFQQTFRKNEDYDVDVFAHYWFEEGGVYTGMPWSNLPNPIPISNDTHSVIQKGYQPLKVKWDPPMKREDHAKSAIGHLPFNLTSMYVSLKRSFDLIDHPEQYDFIVRFRYDCKVEPFPHLRDMDNDKIHFPGFHTSGNMLMNHAWVTPGKFGRAAFDLIGTWSELKEPIVDEKLMYQVLVKNGLVHRLKLWDYNSQFAAPLWRGLAFQNLTK